LATGEYFHYSVNVKFLWFVGGENLPPEPEAGFNYLVPAGYGFPEVGFLRILDFTRKKTITTAISTM